MTLPLEMFLSGDDTIIDRLLKGSHNTDKRKLKLEDELNKLSATVANGRSMTPQK